MLHDLYLIIIIFYSIYSNTVVFQLSQHLMHKNIVLLATSCLCSTTTSKYIRFIIICTLINSERMNTKEVEIIAFDT